MFNNIEIINTKTDASTIKVNNFFLHSKYDPKKEARQIADKNFKRNYTHILFGNGLGYISDALYEKMDERSSLLIIDPLQQELQKFKVKNNDSIIIQELTKQNFETYLGAKLNSFDRKFTIICSPNYEKLFPSHYKKLLVLLKDEMNFNTINENTIRKFDLVWQKNYINNLFFAKKDSSLFNLQKKFNSPVVIASAGPSLSKQIPLLKKYRDKMILIASGSTINTLLSHEIEPDFVVSIDGGEKNFNHFRLLNLNKAKLIYSMTNHYKIRNSFNKESYFFLSNESWGNKKHIELTLDKKVPQVLGGGSVANYALSIANYITSGPIALIGQDLAYTSNKTHAENNKNFKVIDEVYKKERGLFYTQGYNSDEVLTDYVFLSVKDTFESLGKIIKTENTLYNCTEGGIKIEEFIQTSFETFCDEFMEDIVKKDVSLSKEYNDYRDFEKKISDEVLNYNRIITILKKSLNALAMNKNVLFFSKKTLGVLESTDKNLEKFFSKVSMSTILEPISIDTHRNYQGKENENEKERFERVFKRNMTFYTNLLDATETSKKYTEELLELIKNHIKKEDGND